MFGNKPLVGFYEGKIDEKNRIFIPAKYNTEPSEILYFIPLSDNNSYILTTFDRITNIDITSFDESITDISFPTIKETTVDKQKRIIIPKGFRETFKDNIYLLGFNNHAIITNKEGLIAYSKRIHSEISFNSISIKPQKRGLTK